MKTFKQWLVEKLAMVDDIGGEPQLVGSESKSKKKKKGKKKLKRVLDVGGEPITTD